MRLTGVVHHIGYTKRMTPGELLRNARRRHGVTQQQLAARARTSQAAISRIERDVVSPSLSTLATLLDLLGEELELAARPIDYGHDRTLLERNLRMPVSERIAHGSAYPSYDVDIAYARAHDNLERLAAALRELGATLRGAPAGLPFQLDAKALENGAKFTFDTEFGSLDILSDPDGAPKYAQLRAAAAPPVDFE